PVLADTRSPPHGGPILVVPAVPRPAPAAAAGNPGRRTPVRAVRLQRGWFWPATACRRPVRRRATPALRPGWPAAPALPAAAPPRTTPATRRAAGGRCAGGLPARRGRSALPRRG